MSCKEKYKGIFQRFLSDSNPEHWIDDGFADFMWNLGFEMDCYKSFDELYVMPDGIADKKARQDWILSKLDQATTQVVGNYIFSRFRYLTHWCDYGYDDVESSYFFPIAFAILERKLIEDNVVRTPIAR